MLVVIGKKDMQIDWKIDGRALVEATSLKNAVTFAYPDNANHMLKHEAKPREKLNARYVGSQYNSHKTQLDKQAANVTFDWLKAQSLLEG